jgi:hypothetical protein
MIVLYTDMQLYHIPIPSLWPTEEEAKYATEKIIPVAEESARNLFERLGPKFDKTYIDQDLVLSWGTGQRMKAHVEELGLSLKAFSVFVGAPGTLSARPHVDGLGSGIVDDKIVGSAMIARLNVPLRGITGSRLNWWKTGTNDPRILERHFEEWNARTKAWQKGFSYLADPKLDWEEPDWYIDEPGPCWNRTELAHRLDLHNTTEIRINITAEILVPVSWATLVERLHARGYC